MIDPIACDAKTFASRNAAASSVIARHSAASAGRWSAAYASEALAFTHALVEAATGEAQRAGEGDRDAAGAALDLAEAVESCLAPTPEIRRLAEALRARVAEKVRQVLV